MNLLWFECKLHQALGRILIIFVQIENNRLQSILFFEEKPIDKRNILIFHDKGDLCGGEVDLCGRKIRLQIIF